jgi:hypothetical protein
MEGVIFYIIFTDHSKEGNSIVKHIHWMRNDIYIETHEIFKQDTFSSIFTSKTIFTSISLLWQPNVFGLSNFLMTVKQNDNIDGIDRYDIYTADSLQRTISRIQGFIPFTAVTIPNGLKAISRDSLHAVLIASSGSNLFTIDSMRCSTQNSKPTYWDGSTCIQHFCERTRQCSLDNSQTWNSSLMRCVCKKGYYRSSGISQNLICTLCSMNSYCDNQISISCPSNRITRHSGSHSIVQCICPDGHYYDPSSINQCQQCKIDKWCPNNWDSFSCPGVPLNLDTSSASSLIVRPLGSTYPVSCSCAPGFIGPKCSPCSSGKICPQSLKSEPDMTNFAVRIYISHFFEEHLSLTSSSPSEIEDILFSIAFQRLSYLFSTSGKYYFMDIGTFQQRFYCKYLESNDILRNYPILLLMIQVDKSDQNLNLINLMSSIDTYIYSSTSSLAVTFSTSNLGKYISINQILPSLSPTFFNILNNTEQLCTVGKTPNEKRIACVCDKGYETSGVRCIACLQGTYKADIGSGICIPCPLGKISGIASATCTDNQEDKGGVNSDDEPNSENNDKTFLIIGSVVGGVLFVIIMVYGYIRFLSS